MRATCRVLQDTLIRQRTPASSYDTYPKGWAHSAVEGIAGSWIEALMRFDLSTCLPAGAQVTAASLRVYVTNSSTYPFEVYELLRPFTAAATWNVYASAAGWTSPGAMGASIDYGARLASFTSAPLGSLTIPLATSVVQGWVGAQSRAIVVRPTGTPGTNNAPVGVGFRSLEHISGSPPILDVTYSIPDTTSPTITNVVVTPTATSATIQWTTSEPANGQVAYGTTMSYGMTTALTGGGLTAHSHTLSGLSSAQQYYYRITSRDAAGNARAATGSVTTHSGSAGGPTFKIVAWNMHYGKGMTAKAAGMSCPVPNLKENAQCQIADDPATPINEREEERRQSAWGTGLTQRYLNSPMALGDPEVIALLLTEVNGGTCFSQTDLMNVVRQVWPGARISRSHKDNWIVARWGFVAGVVNYAERNLPVCGSSPAQGIQWGRIYAQDPDPDGDGVPMTNPRVVNVFNTHWAPVATNPDGTRFFCPESATATRDFLNAPAIGIDLTSEPRIIGGDFNIEDVIRPYEVSVCEPWGGRESYDVLRAAGFADAFAVPGATKITPTADGATGMVGRPTTEVCYRSYSHNGLYMPYKRIDQQWFRGSSAAGRNLRTLSFELIGVEQFGNCVPSDHMGTKVQYQWY